MDEFESLLRRLLGPRDGADVPLLFDPEAWLERPGASGQDAVPQLTAAFLIALCGPTHPAASRALAVVDDPPLAAPDGLAGFYRSGLDLIRREVRHAAASDAGVAARLASALEQSAVSGDRQAAAEALWTLFFPEGTGILGHEAERIASLRDRRTVDVSALNPHPIRDATREVLFTSNVLLTVPAASTDIDALPYQRSMKRRLTAAMAEPQQHWYDHPIQIGVEPARNELIYGLRGLDEAVAFERRRNPRLGPVTVVLSVSVTHAGLRELTRDYVREELRRGGPLEHLAVHVFTEDDSRRLLEDVLLAGGGESEELADVFGVDGEYGRHYSFLKAIAAVWSVLVDPGIRGTFKIDLDQVFPQDVLVAETGRTALGHLATPLWGATGTDSDGRPVELGMIAGALVNERDIGRGLFTPDVAFPDGPATLDEYVFFSRLPQALSTRAEMMERYDSPERDGRSRCLQRVHVTGGTNGILVDALRRHRPFTPSFIGRAEDQAYILSVLDRTTSTDASEGPRLAYAHAAGLIMRHDKEAFAAEAIEAARVGKLVGDDVRILYFSAYGDVVGRQRAKQLLDPFTGCFISALPASVVLLRFALRTAHAYQRGDPQLARELVVTGAPRIGQALDFVEDRGRLQRLIEGERAAWHYFYDTLERLEEGLAAGSAQAAALRETAQRLIAGTRITQPG